MDSTATALRKLGTLPDVAGTFSGTLVICGDGRSVWADLEKLGCASKECGGSVAGPYDFMCINLVGTRFPGKFRHWYSNDGKWLANLGKCRRPEFVKYFWPEAVMLHSNMPTPGVVVWPWRGPGTSGLNAAMTGLGLGYDGVILCGLPLDDDGHDGDPPWRRTNFRREAAGTQDHDENRFWKTARLTYFGGRVKSMSGRTRDWLGAP